jgi:hypothetical protein
VVRPYPVPPAVAIGGLIVLDAGLLIFDSYEGHKLYSAWKLSQNPPGWEATPTTNPNNYEPVRGTPAKRNKITGEIWAPDHSGHYGGLHYEAYRNKRDWENGKRDRAVDPNGNLIINY